MTKYQSLKFGSGTTDLSQSACHSGFCFFPVIELMKYSIRRRTREGALQAPGVQKHSLSRHAVKRFSMTVKETSKQIAVRFKPPLFERLELRAQEEHRTVAGMIQHLCAAGLEACNPSDQEQAAS